MGYVRRLGVIIVLISVVACSGSSGGRDDGGRFDVPRPSDDAGPDYRNEPGVAECVAALRAIPEDALHVERRLDPAYGEVITSAVRVCLSRYIQINTSNPRREGEPGETAAAHFFGGIFQHLEIPFVFTELSGSPDPERLSIVATLSGRHRDDSIVLLSHTDVVRADGEWTHPPFSGHDDGEFVWGRGALDMKIISILQLVSMAVLDRSGLELERDIHFAAVADEEVAGAGAEWIALTDRNEEGRPTGIDPLDLRPGIVLNEGGTAVADALIPGRDVFLIGSEEKGLTWMQIAAPRPEHLLRALTRAAIAKPPPAEALPEASLMTELANRCTWVGLISDEEQKTNVQPRQSTITLECTGSSVSLVEQAIAPLQRIEPRPIVTVSSSGSRIEIRIEQGVGGHGSTSVGFTALDVALVAVVATGQIEASALAVDPRARDRFFSFALSPANEELVSTLGRVVGPVTGSLAGWLSEQEWFASLAGEQAGPLLPSEIPFRNTCSWTTFAFPIHGEARAKLDCRLIHQMRASEFEERLLSFMGETAPIELRSSGADCFDCAQQEFSSSPTEGNADFATLRYITERSTPNAIVTPYLFPASSDSFFFRLAGVPTYGFMPASLSQELLTTFHAIDERFPIDQMFGAQRTYTEVLLRMATRTPVAPADDAHRLSASVSCFEWDDVLIGEDTWRPVPEIECSVNTRQYACIASAEAPRFLRARAEDHDVRLRRVDRLRDDFVRSGPPPTDASDPRVTEVIFRPREVDAALPHRLFEGQEFELDTGIGEVRQFFVECELAPTVNIVDDAELVFYRD